MIRTGTLLSGLVAVVLACSSCPLAGGENWPGGLVKLASSRNRPEASPL